MQEPVPNIEQRITILEQKLAELERITGIPGKIDIALLISALMARTDGFVSDLAEIKKGQTRMFDQLATGQRETTSDQADLGKRLESLEAGFDRLLIIQAGYKSAIEQMSGQVAGLESGQQGIAADIRQLLNIATGQQQQRND